MLELPDAVSNGGGAYLPDPPDLEIKCVHCGSEDFIAQTAGRGESRRVACLKCQGCGSAADFDKHVRPEGISEGIHARVHETLAGEAEAETRGWAIYLIVNPVSQLAFYVGISIRPRARFYQHLHAAEGPVRSWVEKNDINPHMVVIGRFRTWSEARMAEERLIAFIPGLVNGDVEGTRLRMRFHEPPHLVSPRGRTAEEGGGE